MFTNVANPLSWNFCQDTIPEVLKGAPQFQIDNPAALRAKYLKLKSDPNMENIKTKMRIEVEDGERNALEMLVGFFDWLDSLERQSTTEVVSLYEESQNIKSNTTKLPSLIDQAAAMKARSSSGLSALWQGAARSPRPITIRKMTTRIWGRK